MTRGRGGGGGGGYNRRRGGGGGGRGRGGGSGFGQIIIGEELKIALSLSLKKFKVSSQYYEYLVHFLRHQTSDDIRGDNYILDKLKVLICLG